MVVLALEDLELIPKDVLRVPLDCAPCPIADDSAPVPLASRPTAVALDVPDADALPSLVHVPP